MTEMAALGKHSDLQAAECNDQGCPASQQDALASCQLLGTLSTVGFVVESPDSAVAFTSDTCRTDEIWAAASQREHLKAVFVDCSFPDELESLAIASGHLTPKLVSEEAAKLTRPARILCVHIKTDTREKVLRQLVSHRGESIIPVEIGKVYTF